MSTKEDIIKAAISIIAEYGSRGVNNKAIAEKCGVSSASIYYHFKNQQDLFQNVKRYVVEREAEVLSTVYNCDNSYEDNYVNMLTAIASFYIKNQDILLCYIAGILRKQKDIDEDLIKICPLSLMLLRGIREGAIREISNSGRVVDILSISLYPLCLFLKFHFDNNQIPQEKSIRELINGMWLAIKK